MAIQLSVRDADKIYTLAEFGEALMVEDIPTSEVCQVDLKEMSPFEQSVYLFLMAEG